MIQNEGEEIDDSEEYEEEAIDPIREELNRLDHKQLIESYEKESMIAFKRIRNPNNSPNCSVVHKYTKRSTNRPHITSS